MFMIYKKSLICKLYFVLRQKFSKILYLLFLWLYNNLTQQKIWIFFNSLKAGKKSSAMIFLSKGELLKIFIYFSSFWNFEASRTPLSHSHSWKASSSVDALSALDGRWTTSRRKAILLSSWWIIKWRRPFWWYLAPIKRGSITVHREPIDRGSIMDRCEECVGLRIRNRWMF